MSTCNVRVQQRSSGKSYTIHDIEGNAYYTVPTEEMPEWLMHRISVLALAEPMKIIEGLGMRYSKEHEDGYPVFYLTVGGPLPEKYMVKYYG